MHRATHFISVALALAFSSAVVGAQEDIQLRQRAVTLVERANAASMARPFAPLLDAQEIDIRVLSGRNGKPITNECLNVSLGSWHGGDLVAPTNRDGVVVLRFENNQATAAAASPHDCNGTAVLGPKAVPFGTDAITVSGDYYIACQEHGKIISGEPVTPNLLKEVMPSYPIKKILESGLSAANTCGKFRAEPKPGELIFYVRPRSFSEKTRQ
jgi:hypothetical protein